ncbi:MAG: hypothetical protein KBA51_04655 [Kiritimatiellae bacterium]|nr:hypothetical protein [Kiritimatiellia bacterium]
MAIIADIHVHVRPAHEPGRLLTGGARRLRALAAAAGYPDAIPVLCLTESGRARAFERWSDGALPEGWALQDRSADGRAVCLCGPETPALWIVAGRQCATRERMEVHALGCAADIPDDRPADQTIEVILQDGAQPVIAWALGKWMFQRGVRLAGLLDRFSKEQLVLADSALRPMGWPTPSPLRRAAREDRPVLAGTDPLPPPGEEDICGTWATLVPDAHPDPARRAAGLVEALCSALPRKNVGRRNSVVQFLLRVIRSRVSRAPE